MPVLVNYNKCNCAPTCFASMACPNDALHVDKVALKVWVEPEKCGECPGKCLNFCDAVALKFAPSLAELAILQQELDGELTAEQALEARNALMEEMKARAEAEKEEQQVVITKPVTVTAENFMQEVVESEQPVVIDFWAEWCGPCKQMAPAFEELAQEYAGVIKFAKLNVDEEQEVAAQFGIQSIPTLVVIYQKQIVDMIVGAVPKPQLKARLDRVAQALAQANAMSGGQPRSTQPAAQAQPAAPDQPKPDIARASIRPRMHRR